MKIKKIMYYSGGITIAGIVSVGGYYLSAGKSNNYDGQKNEIENKMLEIKFKNTDTSKYQENTVGYSYGQLLLDAHSKENESAWKNKFDALVAANITGSLEFTGSVISSYFSEDANNNTALNKTCERYYGKTPASEGEEAGLKIGDENWKAMWKFCSRWNPKMIDANNNYPENAIGKTNPEKLLSTSGEDNKNLWEHKNKLFFELKSSPSEEIFKQLYENKDKHMEGFNLREKCDEAYKVIPGTENKPSVEEVIKYCSLKNIL